MYYVPCRPPRRLVITPYSCPTAYRDMNGERGSRDRRKEGEKEADWWPRFRGPTDSVQVSKTDMRPVWMMKTKGRKAPRDKNCVDAMTLMRQNSKYSQMYSSKQRWWKEVERDLIDDPCSWIRPKPVPKSHVCATIAAQPTDPKTHLTQRKIKS